MIKYKALYLIGSSHIAIESVNLVESSFSKINPSIVALELDSQRAASLMSSGGRNEKSNRACKVKEEKDSFD